MREKPDSSAGVAKHDGGNRKGAPLMKTFRISIAAPVAVATALAFVVGSALAATPKKVAFTAKYSGTAVTKVTNNIADISATGTGTGTLVGASKISGHGTGDTSVQPCVPFTGTGLITGTGTTKLTFKVIPGSSSCGDEKGEVFSISAHATVIKGTGKLAKAKGTLKLTGVYDRTAGTFSVKLFGTLTH
jgi:hypothetical protein